MFTCRIKIYSLGLKNMNKSLPFATSGVAHDILSWSTHLFSPTIWNDIIANDHFFHFERRCLMRRISSSLKNSEHQQLIKLVTKFLSWSITRRKTLIYSKSNGDEPKENPPWSGSRPPWLCLKIKEMQVLQKCLKNTNYAQN